MERKYIRVTPSREQINPDDIVSHISSLHKITKLNHSQSMRSQLSPFNQTGSDVPMFEFLAVSQGKDSPVEFLYGTTPKHIDTLENRLMTAYPASFDVEQVTVDVLEKIIPPEKYKPEDFVKRVKDGHLLFDPEATGTPDDIAGESERTDGKGDSENGNQQADNREQFDEGDDEHKVKANGGSAAQQNQGAYTKRTDLSLNVDRPSDTTRHHEEEAVTDQGEVRSLSPSDIDGYSMLKELDAGLLEMVDLPDEVEAAELNHDIEGPTWTEDGEILARPTLENGQPVGVRWHGSGERKKDWMTTLKMFSKVAEPGAPEIQDRAPLATLIQHLSSSDLPIAFQVVFKRIDDWSRQAERRKDNLHLKRDTFRQKVMYEVGELIHKPSKERRRERKRDHMEDMGESADTNEESPATGDVGKRRKLIDNKIPKRTFRTNIRAVSVANREVPVEDVVKTMEDLTTVLDHIDGYFYELSPEILRDSNGFRNKKQATEEFHKLVNRQIVTGSGRKRPDLVMNADELANFIAVPSSESLTVKGVRGTRAEAEARDPLPKPDPDLMREFHQPGMRIGYALDKEAECEPVPTQVPPSLLTKHYGRFATTGAGKSKALINDILSLHENTSGPIVLLDPKGDGMTVNYMKAHYERFGEEDFKENVVHYPIPDILPGFTFFNIEPALNQGMRRSDAIQNKADHYQELLKLVMGKENYEDSKVAPTLISALIKVLFDEYYVEQKQREKERGEIDSILGDRESPNKFTHRHLEKLTKQVRLYGTTNGEKGEIPDVSNESVRDTLDEQAQGDAHTFSTIMNAVSNRINYIREDKHLRQIFNNTTEKFDFRDHLNDEKVILFDMGDLRDDATMVMTGLILTNLWDALQESDRSLCTHGHDSITECRQKARENGLDPERPQCRSSWPEDHLVNIIIDEAASVASSSIINKMLEQGRSFHLSVGLSMQFPEQMKSAGSDRVYKNVLNNVATKLIGKITLDEEIAKAMSHEAMDVDQFSDRIKALPRGEWIAQLPSPNFMETGPEPFSLKPMPIPTGHPESEYVFNSETKQRFEYCLDNYVHRRTREEYGIVEDEEGYNHSPNDQVSDVDESMIEGGHNSTDSREASDTRTATSQNTTTGGAAETDENTDQSDDYSDTKISEVNVSPELLDQGMIDTTESDEDVKDTSDNPRDEAARTDGSPQMDRELAGGGVSEVVRKQREGEEDAGSLSASSNLNQGDGSGEASNKQEQAGHQTKAGEVEPHTLTTISGQKHEESDLPGHISWKDTTELFECLICGEEYFSGERRNAVNCCSERVSEYVKNIGDVSQLSTTKNNNNTTTVTGLHEISSLRGPNTTVNIETIVTDDQLQPPEDVMINEDGSVETAIDILDAINQFDPQTVGCIVSSIISSIPPEYQQAQREIIKWLRDQLKHTSDVPDSLKNGSIDALRKYAYETPPSNIDINTHELLSWIGDDIDPETIKQWESNTYQNKAIKRFISAPLPIEGTEMVQSAEIGATYGHQYGLGRPIDEKVTSPLCFSFRNINIPDEDTSNDTNKSSTEKTDDIQLDVPVQIVEAPGITQDHLQTYGIKRREARFMRAVVRASNGELEGYNLTESMQSNIKDYYDGDTEKEIVDIEKLIKKGYLKKHLGAQGHIYYTVTAEGQQACGIHKKKGREIGDVGSDTPHRVGMELAAQYYESQPHVYRVKRAASESGNDTDLVAVDEYGNRVAIVEVEAGKISSDTTPTEDDRVGINDYESIRKDYKILANSSGESVWIVRNHEIAARVVKALATGDDNNVDIPPEQVDKLQDRKIPFTRFYNKYIKPLDAPGIDTILTYKQVRDKIPE